jgi:hypothetical protein
MHLKSMMDDLDDDDSNTDLVDKTPMSQRLKHVGHRTAFDRV